jgi:hypothetical protein
MLKQNFAMEDQERPITNYKWANNKSHIHIKPHYHNKLELINNHQHSTCGKVS